VAAALFLIAAHPASAAARITGDEFVRRLENARSLSQEGVDAISPEKMDAIRGIVGLPLTVEYPGWTVEIPEDPLIESLEGDSPQDFQLAARRYGALLHDAQEAQSAHPVDGPALGRALSRATGATDGGRSLLDRIGARITTAIRSLAARLAHFTGLGTVVAWIVVLFAVASVAWVVARTRLVPERNLRDRGGGHEPASGTDWHRAAQEALARGDLREGVRLLYRALLAALARRGVLVESESVTAGECRELVRVGQPAIYAAVAEATTAFERVVYGEAPAGTSDIDTLRLAERLASTR